MAFLNKRERSFLAAVSDLAHCNPFLPERIDLERKVLGPEFLESEPIWSMQVDDPKKPRANSWRVHEHVESLVDRLRQSCATGIIISSFRVSPLRVRERRVTRSPVSSRFIAPSTIFSNRSSGARSLLPDCGRLCGNPSSPMTCGAIAAFSMIAWEILPP